MHNAQGDQLYGLSLRMCVCARERFPCSPVVPVPWLRLLPALPDYDKRRQVGDL